ncbi:hypothetical protein AN957_11195 [Cytobacillus solani]|uniref:Uncharacterized protein n=1 Tax=Cytobacillus solani TaxID=1637975 RepID=A0A0Q3T6H8_9BACI|nr:hypothetical protein AN957_11195 [Cytobacillus solani]
MTQEWSNTPAKPEIKSINTAYPQNGIWVQIPKETHKITFHVEAENTKSVLFWLIPTGTQTWTERKLIGYDMRENQNDNIFSLTLNIDKPYLNDHLYIQVIGEGKVANDIINLSMN